jgi:medium-chain acyl-[acyl-carrier-protein] hydrolase
MSNHLLFKDFFPAETSAKTLYCLPYAGGGANMYRNWAMKLKPGIKVKALSMPGREERFKEKPYDDFIALKKDFYELLNNNCSEPYAIFGYSLGALLAFEVLQEFLKNNQKMPTHFFVAGMSAPHKIGPRRCYEELSDDAVMQILLSDPHNLARNNPSMAQFQRLLLPTLRADHLLYEKYECLSAERLSCPISVFGGDADSEHPLANLKPWEELSTHPVEVRLYEGEHMFWYGFEGVVMREVLTQL